MKSYPILMSRPMARATGRGLKTETRRTKKPAYNIGDVLYVKETAAIGAGSTILYRADCDTDDEELEVFNTYGVKRWTPSLFMKKEQSRFALTVTELYSEPLHNITNFDAIAEGVMCYGLWKDYTKCDTWYNYLTGDVVPTARDSYRTLWTKINGGQDYRIIKPNPNLYWDANPDVWVIKFEVSVNPELRFKGICSQCERYKGTYQVDSYELDMNGKNIVRCLCDACAEENSKEI